MDFFVKNFRGFDREARMTLAPITCLLGPNSGGKSSLIRFFSAVATSFSAESSVQGDRALARRGRGFDLGPASEFMSGHDITLPLEFGFTEPPRDLRAALGEEMSASLERSRPTKHEIQARRDRLINDGCIPSWEIRWKLRVAQNGTELEWQNIQVSGPSGAAERIVSICHLHKEPEFVGGLSQAELFGVCQGLARLAHSWGRWAGPSGHDAYLTHPRVMFKDRLSSKEVFQVMADIRSRHETVFDPLPQEMLFKAYAPLMDNSSERPTALLLVRRFVTDAVLACQESRKSLEGLLLFLGTSVFSANDGFAIVVQEDNEAFGDVLLSTLLAHNDALEVTQSEFARSSGSSAYLQRTSSKFWRDLWVQWRGGQGRRVLVLRPFRRFADFLYGGQFAAQHQSTLFSRLIERVRQRIATLEHLPPLRPVPPRVELESETSGWAQLLKLDIDGKNLVDKWLEMLGTGYRVDWKRSTHRDDFNHAYISPRLSARNRGDLSISLLDVGFGVSQIIPIVLASALGRQRPQSRYGRQGNYVVSVEQPELHLHPRVQSRLAQMFSESLREHGTQYLIETHSEHLVVRLQREIDSGHLSASDVALHWVNAELRDENGNLMGPVTPMPLDTQGRFLVPWPEGFFDEQA